MNGKRASATAATLRLRASGHEFLGAILRFKQAASRMDANRGAAPVLWDWFNQNDADAMLLRRELTEVTDRVQELAEMLDEVVQHLGYVRTPPVESDDGL